ncbi:MAG: T9SS type A sorting domain-containing protein, partial [Bacteroidia bacterium]|nr:T9SS type A sorting domain-containing protein [Bacteroidia bacterium]
NGSAFNPDIWIIKLDSMGNMEWDRTFGEAGKGDGALSVCRSADGGYVAAGTTSSYGEGYPSIWIIKLDPAGDTLWTRVYQGRIVSSAYCIAQTNDTGYIVAGKGEENILKMDSAGNREWGTHFSRVLYSIAQTADSGYIAAGDSIYRQLDWNYIPSVSIVKLDRKGNLEWNNPLGDDFPGRANCILPTSDGGYIVAGDSIGFISEFEYSQYLMVIKLDKNGKREWNYFGGRYSDAQFIQQTADEGYVVAGNKNDEVNGLDLTLIKLDKNGKEEWKRVYGSSGWEYASAVEQTDDGGYLVSGQTDSYGAGLYDMWILKLDKNGDGPGAAGIPDAGRPKGFSLLQNHPNPFDRTTTFQFRLPESGLVTLSVYNIMGETIQTIVSRQYPAGEFRVDWTPENLPGGIYFYRLQAGPNLESKRMILLR